MRPNEVAEIMNSIYDKIENNSVPEDEGGFLNDVSTTFFMGIVREALLEYKGDRYDSKTVD